MSLVSFKFSSVNEHFLLNFIGNVPFKDIGYNFCMIFESSIFIKIFGIKSYAKDTMYLFVYINCLPFIHNISFWIFITNSHYAISSI